MPRAEQWRRCQAEYKRALRDRLQHHRHTRQAAAPIHDPAGVALARELGVPYDPVLVADGVDGLQEALRAAAADVRAMEEALAVQEQQLALLRDTNGALGAFTAERAGSEGRRRAVEQTQARNIGTLTQKQAEYVDRLRGCCTDPWPSAAELGGLEHEVALLEAEGRQLQTQLEAFGRLPPDLTLARIMVAEGEAELEAMVRERDRLLRLQR